ncbi:GNAT family N-acetyltransferase [Parasedimentitalea marina]|uniref:GNAT family N-acetyltransferase n=1 Tax=Parasedimentitalea marina TaxID=2483033 RepID=A0A3T0N806_9RHOB|nr:GNAT family N-acetyltransferase [Parasedimentitalea marina]AZV80158.1 GNAT family N-acetyltransferase [Parasedimentitalea marina]
MSPLISITNDHDICFALRHQVFVVEQDVPVEEEIDELDKLATHLLATEKGLPIGTARVVYQGDIAKIGRVCVLKSARGTGLGAGLIKAAVQIARDRPDVSKAKLGAQLHALGFYEKLGFSVDGPVYLDAGIEHRDMVLTF